MERAVRESARSNKFSRDDRFCRRASVWLIPDDFSVIGRNHDSDQLELVVIVHPQVPKEIFPTQIQAQQVPVGTANIHFFAAHQF